MLDSHHSFSSKGEDQKQNYDSGGQSGEEPENQGAQEGLQRLNARMRAAWVAM